MPSTDLPAKAGARSLVPAGHRRGLLLVNLGTPDDTGVPAVRRYLREFLMDGRVIDFKPLWRWLFVNAIILPRRPKNSAHAYRSIWHPQRGSPLMFHSQDLTSAVKQKLAGEFEVELAMRYGNPSLPSVIEKMVQRGVSELTVIPLYPQGAASSSGSTIARIYELMAQRWESLPVRVVPPFFDDPGFLDAFAQVAKRSIDQAKPDHVLFSFHGVPERHVKKSDPTGQHCLSSASCSDSLTPANRTCYRAQSFATARGIAQRLGLGPPDYTIAFQSRLGRAKWIEPYTDASFTRLAKEGKKRLVVVCPSFVADCLETLEEIGIRGREQFKHDGGEELTMVPSLNAEPAWVDVICRLAREGGVRHTVAA